MLFTCLFIFVIIFVISLFVLNKCEYVYFFYSPVIQLCIVLFTKNMQVQPFPYLLEIFIEVFICQIIYIRMHVSFYVYLYGVLLFSAQVTVV